MEVGWRLDDPVTIIATKPNDEMAPIRKRMPVILPKTVWPEWLGEREAPSDAPAKLLVPYGGHLEEAWIDVLAQPRALIAIDRGERHVCAVVRVPSIEGEDARRSHRSGSVSSVSEPAISIASRACCLLKAFVPSSRSCA